MKQVPGDLGLGEQIVGKIAVESLHHPVPVAIGVGIGIVPGVVEPVVGIAGQIQPVAPPALSVVRRGQQAVDHLGEGQRRAVPDEGLHLLRRGGQADQVQAGPPYEYPPPCRFHRTHSLGLQPGQDESIDGRPGPLTVCGCGRRRLADGLEAPEGPLFGSDAVGVAVFTLRLRRLVLRFRPEGARADPGLQVADLVGIQGIPGRHLETGVGAPDRLDQQAGLRVPRKDGGTRLAPLQDRLAGIQPEAALR